MAAYPVPPEGFKTERANIPHGELKVVEYDSKTLGTRRLMRVYTPPGYSADRKYPVLYLHHGLGNTSTEWLRAVAPALPLGKTMIIGCIFPSASRLSAMICAPARSHSVLVLPSPWCR